MEQASFTVNASTLVDKHIATVLVVDDTPENLTLMGSLLRDHFMVKVANNGEKALKIAMSDTPPDLVLLDIMMPGTDGYEVCRRLKATAATRDIPVIFLTARSDPDDERMGLALGGGGLHHQAHQPAHFAGAGQHPPGTQGDCRFSAR